MKLINKAKSLLHIVVSVTILIYLQIDKVVQQLLMERPFSFYFSLFNFGIINYYFIYFGFYLPFIKKKIVENLYRDYKPHIIMLTVDTFFALVMTSIALTSYMGGFGILCAFLLIHINFKCADFIPSLHSVGQTDIQTQELGNLKEHYEQ